MESPNTASKRGGRGGGGALSGMGCGGAGGPRRRLYATSGSESGAAAKVGREGGGW